MKKLGNVTHRRSDAEMRQRLAELKPLIDLAQNPAMVRWIEGVEADLEKLGEAKWCATPGDLESLGRMIGMNNPTADDLPTLFLCARSVVVFLKMKLKPLREASKEFNALQKELETLGERMRRVR